MGEAVCPACGHEAWDETIPVGYRGDMCSGAGTAACKSNINELDAKAAYWRARAVAAETGAVMRFGVYRKIEGRTGVGHLYQFLMLTRHHTTGQHFVVYIPLRIEPEWAGTIRPCILERELFEQKFEFVGEALPAARLHKGE